MFGHTMNVSVPHARWRAGLTSGGRFSLLLIASGLSHGPNRPLRIAFSDGLTMLGSFGGAMPPHDDTTECGLKMS